MPALAFVPLQGYSGIIPREVTNGNRRKCLRISGGPICEELLTLTRNFFAKD